MNFYSIIIARGGSAGIPNKNIININSIPLIAYTIKQCNSAGIKNIYTSSDSDEILDIARSFGSKTIKRPLKYATSISTSEEAWLHAISSIGNIDYKNDWIFAPQVTSPLREKKDILKACSLARSGKFDSLLSVVKFEDFFLWEDLGKEIKAINHDYKTRKRRQEIKKKTLLENGSFYMFKPSGLLKYKNRLHEKIGYVEMEKNKMYQIDGFEDIPIVEYFLKELNIK